jgi:hypothetical protein
MNGDTPKNLHKTRGTTPIYLTLALQMNSEKPIEILGSFPKELLMYKLKVASKR